MTSDARREFGEPSPSPLDTAHSTLHCERTYRRLVAKDLVSFEVKTQETDLHISASRWLRDEAERAVRQVRSDLETHIARDPRFRATFVPHDVLADAPPVVQLMAEAARRANVGPMASVAGAIAELVGFELLRECEEVLVENGGDLFLRSHHARTVAIFAGTSALSMKVGLRIPSEMTPVGVCTSSGTVGPSFSFGQADAVTVIAKSAALADAAATAVGNVVEVPDDIEKGLAAAQGISGVLGAVIIKDDRLGAWGEVEMVRITQQ